MDQESEKNNKLNQNEELEHLSELKKEENIQKNINNIKEINCNGKTKNEYKPFNNYGNIKILKYDKNNDPWLVLGPDYIYFFILIILNLLLITFFAAGYLIIYNIFDINIISDMQEYGLLKTVGTSGKQLKKIVMRRANIISLIGIPAGLLLGVGVGALLLPSISNQLNTVTVGKGEVHLNIWILLGAAVFSYLTVIISAQRPCRKASKVSPIETLRSTGESNETGKNKKKS